MSTRKLRKFKATLTVTATVAGAAIDWAGLVPALEADRLDLGVRNDGDGDVFIAAPGSASGTESGFVLAAGAQTIVGDVARSYHETYPILLRAAAGTEACFVDVWEVVG